MSLNQNYTMDKSLNGINYITADEIQTDVLNVATLTTQNIDTTDLIVTGTLTLPANSISDNALSSNVALLNRNPQQFTGVNTFNNQTNFSSGISATNPQSITFGTNAPTMSGANIATNSIQDGSLSSNVPLKNSANQYLGTQTFWAGINATNPQTINFGTNQPTMSGANITAGTIADGALSSNIPKKNASNTFTSTNNFSSGIASAGIDSHQVKIGNGVLQNSTVTNSDNYAIGFNTLQLASTGSTANCCYGAYSANNLTTNSSQNVTIGHTSGGALKTNCNYNLVVGASLGGATQTGNNISNNCIVGTNALYYAKDGCSANVAVGPYSLWNDQGFGGVYSVGIGPNAGVRSGGSQCVYIGGCYAQPSNVTPTYSNFNYVSCIGVDAVATGSNQIVLGTTNETTYIKGSLDVSTAGKSINFGSNAPTMSGANIGEGTIPISKIVKNTTTLNNARICFYAPNSNANITNPDYPGGTYDITLVGALAGNNLDDSSSDFQAITCIGANSYGNAPEGQEIVAVGANAGGLCGPSNFCVFIGSFSGGYANHTASTLIGQGVASSMINNRFNNNIVGSGGFSATTQGDYNTGQGCGVGIANTTGSYNVAIGNYAYSNDTGYESQNSNNCVYIGARSGNGNTSSISNSVAIGYNSQVTSSNTIQLGTSAEMTNITGRMKINNTTSGTDVFVVQKAGTNNYLYINNSDGQIGFWDAGISNHKWFLNGSGDMLLRGQYVNKSIYQNITGAWSTLDINGYFYAVYSVTVTTTGQTVTLPTPSASNVGTKIQFCRVGGTSTNTILCTPTIMTGAGVTLQNTLLGSGAWSSRIICVHLTASTFVWALR